MLRVLLTSVIVFFASQYIITGGKGIFPQKLGYVFYNILSIFCLYSFINIFLWQYEINFLIIVTFIYILSITMYYVHEFRGTNLNFSDIASINTAKEVAGGYSYAIKPIFIILFIFLVFEYIYQIYFCRIDFYKYYHMPLNGISSTNIDLYRFFWHEIAQVILFLISFFVLKDKISMSKFDYSLTAGEKEGYIYNFLSSLPIFHTCDNKNIGNFELTDVQDSTVVLLKKSDMPHIIVIMNESFGTLHERIKTDKPVTPFFDSINDSIKGNLYVNTFGGGTANTEFEFLTGMTVGNYPYPVMPYNNFVKKNKYTLATYFKNIGYETIGMHPYTASNYHRDRVYRYFGFEKEVFINDMKDTSVIRNFVSDESMYKEIINIYKDTKSRKEKLFLFGVTVQNHSGYDNLDNVNVCTNEIDNYKSLDSYMTLMNASDNALKLLIEHFRKENEHTIILFFGDHNASFGTELNKKYYDDNEFGNAYKTPLLIFDNKKTINKKIEIISANFLSLELLKIAGLPFDSFHDMLNETYNKYSAFNYHKAKNRFDNSICDIPNDSYMQYERGYLKK